MISSCSLVYHFFGAHTETTASGPWGNICWIKMAYCPFNGIGERKEDGLRLEIRQRETLWQISKKHLIFDLNGDGWRTTGGMLQGCDCYSDWTTINHFDWGKYLTNIYSSHTGAYLSTSLQFVCALPGLDGVLFCTVCTIIFRRTCYNLRDTCSCRKVNFTHTESELPVTLYVYWPITVNHCLASNRIICSCHVGQICHSHITDRTFPVNTIPVATLLRGAVSSIARLKAQT